MPFYNNEYITILNVELWLIPILLLIILLYTARNRKYKKIIVGISILYTLFMVYNLYYIFWSLLNDSDTLYFYLKYPYGFTFLVFTIFLIINIFLPNRISTIIASVFLIIIFFNQVNLRIVTSKMNIEYKSILEDKSTGNIFSVYIDTADINCSNAPGFDSTYFYNFNIIKTISYTPYIALNEEYFFHFNFPNYYWTQYTNYESKQISLKTDSNFIMPRIVEKVKLKTKSPIDEFYILYYINKTGKLESEPHNFPDSISFINKQEYLNTIKFIPGLLNNLPVDVRFWKKYKQ